MCVTFLMVNPDAGADQWQLVLINNRDELYDRPASSAAWTDGVLAGRDLKGGGTWLAIGETGRIGVLMNILEPPEKQPPNPLTRGSLAVDFVKNGQVSPVRYAEQLGRGEKFAGFALLLLEKSRNEKEKWRMGYYSNRSDSPVEMLSPGIYGFGNSPRNRPFLKVQRGLRLFQEVLLKYMLTTDADRSTFIEALIEVLSDRTQCFPDAQLQSQATHMPPEFQRRLSACFVEFPPEQKYGTRTHTVILIDGQNNVTHLEKTMNEHDPKALWVETRHAFTLEK